MKLYNKFFENAIQKEILRIVTKNSKFEIGPFKNTLYKCKH